MSDQAARPAGAERPGLAVFDFDGTLSRRDSIFGFVVKAAGAARTATAIARSAGPLLRAARDDAARDVAKVRVMAIAFSGSSADHVDEVGRAYAHRLVERELRNDVRARLEWHRAQGHELAIASAALEPYLRPLAERLGVQHLACTRLEVDGRRRLTGALDGANCRRAEKVTRLRELVDTDRYEIWAYGDSRGDTELLAIADHPIWV